MLQPLPWAGHAAHRIRLRVRRRPLELLIEQSPWQARVLERGGAAWIEAIEADPGNGRAIRVKLQPETWLAPDFARQFGLP
jgi:hypothetical protein